MVSGSDGQTIQLWDAQTGKELQTFRDNTDSVTSIVGHSSGQPGPQVSVANGWVSFGNENLIWLPAEFRSFNCLAMRHGRHGRLALGYPNRALVIFGFRND